MCFYMYWIRDIEVLAGQKRFESLGENALYIEFDVSFGDKEEPDVSEVSIYNLSDSTIEDIKRDGYLFLNAGYKFMNNKSNILTGEIEDVITEFSGVDKVTKITVSDGAKKWRTAELNKTYKEGTLASFIMRDLCNVLCYEIEVIEPVEDLEYKLGKTVIGSASLSLQQLVKDTNSKMFVNKNRVVIRAENKGYDTGFVLNAESGLVGSPVLNKDESGDKTDSVDSDKNKKKNEDTKKTWSVVSLLNPQITTDSIIKVESRSLNGTFRVISGKHTKDFNTELIIEEV